MKRYDYLLAGLSVSWVVALVGVSTFTAQRWAFYLTVALICINLLASIVLLIRRGKVQVVLNLAQLPLFCLLNYQLYRAFGTEHYRWRSQPFAWDWIELTGVHFLRAVDVLDGLEEYGIDLQNVEHNSVPAGLLLVWMHVTVDIFLLSLIFRWVSRLWRHRYAKEGARQLAPYLRRGKLVGLLLCVCMLLGCGLSQGWRTSDWLLWPLDNVLRTLDIGDAFQIFDWRLHGVTMGVGTMTLAISFRFFAGIYAAEWLNYLRLTEFEGLGATIDDLVDALGSPRPAVVGSASESLLAKGTVVVPALIHALEDDELRKGASQLLARFGVAAAPALLKVIDHRRAETRAAAARVLGELGSAPGVAPALSRALLDSAVPVRVAAVGALGLMGPPALASLTRALSDQHETVRLAATESLGRLGNPALDSLCKALADESEQVRFAAVASLAPLGGAASAAVLGALGDNSPAVRAAAAWAIARSGAVAHAGGELAAAVQHDASADVRRAALWGLGRLQGRPAVARVLVSALDDDHADVALAAVDALSRFGITENLLDALIAKLDRPAMRPAIVAVLAGCGAAAAPRLIAAQDPSAPAISAAAADVLVGLGPPVVEPLFAALRSGEPGVRRKILTILGRIRPPEAIIPALIPSLEDARLSSTAAKLLLEIGRTAVLPLIDALDASQPGVRQGARQVLHRFGPLSATELCAALVDARPLVREGAAGVLQEMGVGALPALRESLERGATPYKRVAAVEALGRVSPTLDIVRTLVTAQTCEDLETRRAAARVLNGFGAQVLPALTELLANAPAASRQIALKALTRIGQPNETAPILARALEDAELRSTALVMLGEMGPRAAPAAGALCRLVMQGVIADQIAAMGTLGKIGPAPGVVPTLIDRLFAQVPDIRDAAARALHGFGPAAAPALVIALADPNPSVRLLAAQTLGKVAAPEKAVPALIQALSDAFVRPAAAQALGQIGPPAADAVPSLQFMLRVGDPSEKQVAYEALRRIGA